MSPEQEGKIRDVITPMLHDFEDEVDWETDKVEAWLKGACDVISQLTGKNGDEVFDLLIDIANELDQMEAWRIEALPLPNLEDIRVIYVN